MLEIFKEGDAKGVGVANYNASHLQEIKDAGMTMPSVNQCPFNIHRSTSQQETIAFCNKEGILFNSYSSLGIPDLTGDHPKSSALLLHKCVCHTFYVPLPPLKLLCRYPAPMTANILDEPMVASIAAARGLTAAQVHLAWMYKIGIATNPRSMDVEHMQQNLQAPLLAQKLSDTDVMHMMAFPQDLCSLPDQWYECAP